MRVEWDSAKNISNRRKHGLSFEEASELFAVGREYLAIFDDQHSIVEDRFICIGAVRRRVIVAVMTEPEEDVIRIISARRATKREVAMYRNFVGEGRDE